MKACLMAWHSVIGFPLQDRIACPSVADVDGRDGPFSHRISPRTERTPTAT